MAVHLVVTHLQLGYVDVARTVAIEPLEGGADGGIEPPVSREVASHLLELEEGELRRGARRRLAYRVLDLFRGGHAAPRLERRGQRAHSETRRLVAMAELLELVSYPALDVEVVLEVVSQVLKLEDVEGGRRIGRLRKWPPP